MKDLTNPFWIKFKGVMFVLVGVALRELGKGASSSQRAASV